MSVEFSGWQPDPFGLHEFRYFSSGGDPTKLVMDNGVESYDEPPVGAAQTSATLGSAVASDAHTVDTDGVAAPIATQPGGSTERTTFSFCAQCGNRLVAGKQFCPSCGADSGQARSLDGETDQTPKTVASTAVPTSGAQWYPDVEDPSLIRYWDGQAWTQHTKPRLPPTSTAPVSNPLQRSTNGFAVASLVLGLLWLSGIGSILAVIFGVVAQRQIRESRGQQSGRGMAMWGEALGILGIVGLLLLVIVIVWAVEHPSTVNYGNTGGTG